MDNSTRPFQSFHTLWVFSIAAQYLSFKRAAEVLCVTPSAVSQHIKNLEQQLGVSLFERQHQSLILTEAGRWYSIQIIPLLQDIQKHTHTLQQRFGKTVLSISCMPPVASRVIFPKLREFQALYPDIELRFDVSLKHIDLQHSAVDLAIRFGTPPWIGCEHQKLLDLWIQPVCSPQIAAQFELVSKPCQLIKAPLIHMTSRPSAWTQALAALGQHSAEPVSAIYVDDYPAAIEAAYNLGVALALMPLEHIALQRGDLVAIGQPIGRYGEVYAVTRHRRLQEAAIQSFLLWLTTELQSLN